MKKQKTERGFGYYEFKDRNDTVCNIQKSSIATEDAIWLGAKEIGVQKFIPNVGWENIELDESTHIANNRMHLTKKQVKELLPILQKFVETGEI